MASRLPIEKWLPVVGYEGMYEVSDQGRVRGLDRFATNGRKWPGRVKAQKFNANGYRIVRLHKGNVAKTKLVHRLVLESFVGLCPDGMQACHFPDPSKLNNRLCNLRWDTPRANKNDQRAHGTDPAGERNGRAKITEADVRYARQLRREGMTGSDIGKRIGVSPGQANNIVAGRHWAHVN